MAAETADIRNKTRRVKAHILNRYLLLADELEKDGKCSDPELYKDLTLKFAANVIPRSQEVTGEDGGALIVAFDKSFQNATESSNTTRQAEGDSSESSTVQGN